MPLRLFPRILLRTVTCAFLAMLLSSCGQDEGSTENGDSPSSPNAPQAPPVAPSTAAMAERLAALVESLDPEENAYLNRRRARIYRGALKPGLTLRDELDLRVRLSMELLRGGENEQALAELGKIPPLARRLGPQQGRHLTWLVHLYTGLTYLRLAEEENCIGNPQCEACLFPISKSAVHKKERGGRGAIEHLTKALELNSQDPSGAWLLNVAHMTLGGYPDQVPQRWRVPQELLRSDHDIGRFTDVASKVGLATLGLSGGSVVEDIDGDGLLDVVCSSWGLADPLRYFRNRGDGSFEERTDEAGLRGIVGGLNINHADYDNDGDADVLVLRGAWMARDGNHPNSLLRNDGGRFVDVTEAAGLLSFHPTQTAAWGDFDNDGHLDLFIGNESERGSVNPCQLYRNRGDGSFVDVAKKLGVDHVGFVKGCAWGDYDDDGRIDIYLSCLDEENKLFRNTANGFVDVTKAAGVAEPKLSFPTWFFDYDNDGDLDLFVCSYDGRDSLQKFVADYVTKTSPGPFPALYRNDGGRFVDVTRSFGLHRVLIGMGANFGDLDNDGFLDFYIGTGEPDLSALMPNRMFRNNAGEGFQDVTTSGGFGHLQKGHGVSFADIDGDGDQDIFTVLGGAYEGDIFQNALFENPGHGNGWVTLRLEGVKSPRSAVGARVELVVATAKGPRSIHRVVGTGGSFGSSSLALEVGLGQASAITEVRVAWPGVSEAEVFREVPLGRVVRLREGTGRAEPLEAPRYRLGGGS